MIQSTQIASPTQLALLTSPICRKWDPHPTSMPPENQESLGSWPPRNHYLDGLCANYTAGSSSRPNGVTRLLSRKVLIPHLKFFLKMYGIKKKGERGGGHGIDKSVILLRTSGAVGRVPSRGITWNTKHQTTHQTLKRLPWTTCFLFYC